MTGAVLGMTAVALAALVWLTRPLWRVTPPAPLLRRNANVQAYRTRLAEIDQELASGLLDAPKAEVLRQELKARLLDDAGEAPQAEATRPAPATKGAALVLAGLLLAAAGLAYAQWGGWRLAQQIAVGPEKPQGVPSDAEVRAMVQRLADKLAASPDNAEGWAMLGRSYFTLQRYDDAAKAYGEANARSPEPQAEWLSGEGEALALARDRDLLGRPRLLFEQALKADPQDSKSLWYAGLAAAQAGEPAVARRYWQQLLAQDIPDTIRTALQERLQELGGAQPPAAAAVADTKLSAPAPAASALTVTVTIAPALRTAHRADQTLFVFAKAAEGPPMPLAVQRLPAATLPATITLDDGMAMAPSLKLSQFEHYVITARLSASGGAQAQPGDLEGQVAAVRGTRGPIALEINRQVP